MVGRSIRLIAVFAVLVFGGSLTNPMPASAADGAYNATADFMSSDASDRVNGYSKCKTKVITLNAGTYLYRNFDRNIHYTSSGAYSKTFFRDRSVYLAAGDYRWTDCTYLNPNTSTCVPEAPNCASNAYWRRDSALTRISTGGSVRNDVAFGSRPGYDYIVEWGSVLHHCATSSAC